MRQEATGVVRQIRPSAAQIVTKACNLPVLGLGVGRERDQAFRIGPDVRRTDVESLDDSAVPPVTSAATGRLVGPWLIPVNVFVMAGTTLITVIEVESRVEPQLVRQGFWT